MRNFFGVMSPLFAMVGFIVGIVNDFAGVTCLLGAILFHLWSKDDK
jgi:hypothetical protein